MKLASKVLNTFAAAAIATPSTISAMETTCNTPYAVTANRGSGNLSFVTSDGATNFLLPLPTSSGATNDPEPMYVNYSKNKIYVGDRANNAVVVLNPEDLMEEATIISDVCQGIFHQWTNEERLVVACDIDNTVAVINLMDNSIKETIDLMDQGALSINAMQRPHDIVITPSGDAIFVTILASDGSAMDSILKIDTDTSMVVTRIDLPSGTDPHLGLSATSPDLLYSPQQNLGIVAVYNQEDLTEAQTALVVPNAHGIGTATDGKFVYATNIAAGGIGGLATIEAAVGMIDASLVGSALDTPEAVPHNVAVDDDGFVYVTHSGMAADQLSVYSTDVMTGVPTLEDQYMVGTNPFGLAVVEYQCVDDPAENMPTNRPTRKPIGSKSTKSTKRGKSSRRKRGNDISGKSNKRV
jgi:DNA-binding beta-propeller fold protein YncE